MKIVFLLVMHSKVLKEYVERNRLSKIRIIILDNFQSIQWLDQFVKEFFH